MWRMARNRRNIRTELFRIQLTTDAKKQIELLTERFGITQIALTSNLVEWFAEQPDLVRTAILGLYPQVLPDDVVKLILERIERGE